MTVYYNTKSGATAEFTKADLDKLPTDIRKKYRVATESEVDAHNVKKSKAKFKKATEKKAVEKSEDSKAATKKNSKDDKKSEDEKGA